MTAAGRSPFFTNVYEFNTGDDADRGLPGLYYVPFSLSFSEAVALGAPTRAEIETLFNGCKRYFYRVGGQEGVLLRSDTGFLFFPTDMTYWTSSPGEIPGFSLYYYFYYDSDMPMYDIEPETKLRVRGIVR